MRKPKVDENLCIGCGNCSIVEDNVFEMSGATAIVKDLSDYEVYANGIDDAIAGCPSSAISWQNGDESNSTSSFDSENENENSQDEVEEEI
uniref:Ferredoxin n=1 Tax=candidate division CPR3 bacterium TaxID=2268181 RepID=A0A7C4R4Z5_UNCC3